MHVRLLLIVFAVHVASCSNDANTNTNTNTSGHADSMPVGSTPSPTGADTNANAQSDIGSTDPADGASCTCPKGTEPDEDCDCWALTLPIPTTGVTVDETACISAFVPTGSSDHAKKRRAAFFKAMKELRVQKIRQHLLWHQIQPSKTSWNWKSADEVIASTLQNGLSIVGLLGYGNPWASKKGKAEKDYKYPPDDPDDFAKYAAKTVARYSGNVHQWEIWNEQNAGYRFWKGGKGLAGDPKAYGELLALTYKAIKDVDATAAVGYGGLFYYPQFIPGAESFLADSLETNPGLVSQFDALAYHPYPPYPPIAAPDDPGDPKKVKLHTFDEMGARLQAIIAGAQVKEGKAKKKVPLWVTEVGWPTKDAVTPEQAAMYLVRGYALLLAGGAQLLCWYTYMDHPPNAKALAPWEKVFGLYEYSDTGAGDKLVPKTTAKAHQVFFSWLGSRRFVADEGHIGDWQSLAFVANDGRITRVIWDRLQTDGNKREIVFAARPGRKYRAVDMWGLAYPLDRTVAYEVRLKVGESPIYVYEVWQP